MTGRTPPAAAPGVLLAALLLSRIPLLFGGFGSDPDAWRNAVAAFHSLETGRYQPSRVPGFPLFDLVVIALVRLGPVATNAAALLAGLLASGLFFAIARRVVPRAALPAAIAFAFGAPLWVQAGQTMDYAFGTVFALGAYAALLAGRPALAGALLAGAAGCRPSLALLVLAALAHLLAMRARGRDHLRLALGFALTLAVVFAPVLLWSGAGAAPGEFGFHARRQHVTLASAPAIVRAAAAFTLGKLGFIVAAAGVAVALALRLARGRGRGRSEAESRMSLPPYVFEASAVALLAAFYLVIPLDLGYLVPLVPFALLLAFRALASPSWALALALAIASEPLVTPLLAERRVAPGRLVAERLQRVRDLAATEALAAREAQAPTVFVAGRFSIQRLMLTHPELERTSLAWSPFYASGVALWDPASARGFAAHLDSTRADSLRAAGWTIVAVEDRAP